VSEVTLNEIIEVLHGEHVDVLLHTANLTAYTSSLVELVEASWFFVGLKPTAKYKDH
jgi:hypothetical protein